MPNPSSKPVQKKKPYGFLVYIAGGNNLSDAGLEDIQELCDEGASEKVHVGVEIDTYGEYTGSIRYEITEPDFTGEAHRSVIQRLPEKDTGKPKTLSSFLKWGFKRFLASEYIVVVWNHGSGFRGVRKDTAYDDFGTALDMGEIEQVLIAAGLGKSEKKIAILGFDACLMAMLEIAYQFREYVEIIVGSQQSEPGDGWPYDRVLYAMKNSPDSREVASAIVGEYVKSYKETGETDVTQSAVLLDKTRNAMKALNDLGLLLAGEIKSWAGLLRKIRLKAQTFDYADYVDLIHLSGLIFKYIENEDVKKAANELIKCAKDCILESGTYGSKVKNANGLSIWFPARLDLYMDFRAKYLALNASRDYKGWIKFLDAYFSD